MIDETPLECGFSGPRCLRCGDALPPSDPSPDAPYRPYCETCTDLLTEGCDCWRCAVGEPHED